jgi:hypothetical protein
MPDQVRHDKLVLSRWQAGSKKPRRLTGGAWWLQASKWFKSVNWSLTPITLQLPLPQWRVGKGKQPGFWCGAFPRWGKVGMGDGCFAPLLPAEVMLRLAAGR